MRQRLLEGNNLSIVIVDNVVLGDCLQVRVQALVGQQVEWIAETRAINSLFKWSHLKLETGMGDRASSEMESEGREGGGEDMWPVLPMDLGTMGTVRADMTLLL